MQCEMIDPGVLVFSGYVPASPDVEVLLLFAQHVQYIHIANRVAVTR